MKGDKNIIRHSLADGLYVDARLMRTGEDETHFFPFKPTPEECAPRPSLKDLGENGCLEVAVRVKPLDGFILARINMDGIVDVIDDHDMLPKPIEIHEDAELSLSSDPEMADIMPDPDGRYDLRPTMLALFYDAVPNVYSTVPLTKLDGDGYTVYSEDAYEEEEERENVSTNPFSKLLD